MSYRGYAVPKNSYSKPPAERKAADGATGTFSELPVAGGVGDFHINHFIGYSSQVVFSSAMTARLSALNDEFYEDFAEIFSSKNVATAKAREYLHKDNQTIEFELGGNVRKLTDLGISYYELRQLIGFMHSDWVSMQKHAGSGSFYASTLKRKWASEPEKLALAALEKVGKTTDAVLAAASFDLNRHHFLAGRRSFKVGYDPILKRCFVETAALERSSVPFFDFLERSTGFMRVAIIDLWTNLVENFERKYDGGPMMYWLPANGSPEHIPAGYQTRGNVSYQMDTAPLISYAAKKPWFKDVLARHPGLIAGMDTDS